MTTGLTVLKSLTATVFDSAKGFARAAEVASSPHLVTLFTDCADRRRAMAAEMNGEIFRLGGEVEDGTGALGAMHCVYLEIAHAFERGDEAAVERVEEGEDHIETIFREAVEHADFTHETRAILARMHREIAESERMADRLEKQYD